ncbi:hypothetical protein DIPPA_29081 [Diplonema papillatum]|nr:hypothetical protein DIPPA_29078 [Diplonema papillatum]KAJ9448657.1 hypothetical protein DIPPA_29081 [Diplonema papillatum]
MRALVLVMLAVVGWTVFLVVQAFIFDEPELPPVEAWDAECPIPKVNHAAPPKVEKLLDVPPHINCVVIAAFFGSIEKTVKDWKKPLDQAPNCKAYLFTEEPVPWALLKSAALNDFEVRTDGYHLQDPFVKRLHRSNRHPNFLKAKYYKMQMPRYLPPHVEFALWVDGTSYFDEPTGLVYAQERVKTYASLMANTHGTEGVVGEYIVSQSKYRAGYLNTIHLITAWVLDALSDGFCMYWWRVGDYNFEAPFPPSNTHIPPPRMEIPAKTPPCVSDIPADSHGRRPEAYSPSLENEEGFRHGVVMAVQYYCKRCGTCDLVEEFADELIRKLDDVPCRVAKEINSDFVHAPDSDAGLGTFLTNFVAADLTRPRMAEFFDTWYSLTMEHWQDQVSFPVAAWMTGLRPGIISHTCRGPHGK